MTALEQKLLDELERLERERESEREAFKQSLKSLAGQVAEEITETTRILSEKSYTEESDTIELLTTIAQQQAKIISLLEKPPSSDNLSEVLDQALGRFSRELVASLAESNEQLVNDLRELLN